METYNTAALVDKRLGTSYQVVKEVHDALAQIIFVANNFGTLGAKEIELKESDDYQYLQWRRTGDTTWNNLVSLNHLARSLVIPEGTSLGVDDTADTVNAYARTKGQWVLALTKAMLGVAGGVASLGSDGKVPSAQLPAIPQQVQADWNAASGAAAIKNKPTLFSGQYADLSGKPALFSGSYVDLTNKPALFSGKYADLTGKPTIPAAQVQVDWTAVEGLASIKNKPQLFSGDYNDLRNKPVIGENGFSGSYTDLTNKPQLFSGSWVDLTNKPALFSGNYADLAGKPTIPPAQVQPDWNATSGLGAIQNKPKVATLGDDGKVLPSQLPAGSVSTGGGFTPRNVAAGSTFVVPEDNQAFTMLPMNVEGTVQLDGYLIEL